MSTPSLVRTRSPTHGTSRGWGIDRHPVLVVMPGRNDVYPNWVLCGGLANGTSATTSPTWSSRLRTNSIQTDAGHHPTCGYGKANLELAGER
jgi:hypothetical protein